MYQGSPLFPIIRALIVAPPPQAFLCCPSPQATFTPSIQRNLGLPRTRPWLISQSIPFWPYGTHPVFPQAQTISILSDLLYKIYMLANSVSIPALLRTSSFQTLSIRDTPPKLLKHFILRTFTFLLSALLITHAYACGIGNCTIGTITPSYNYYNYSFIQLLLTVRITPYWYNYSLLITPSAKEGKEK